MLKINFIFGTELGVALLLLEVLGGFLMPERGTIYRVRQLKNIKQKTSWTPALLYGLVRSKIALIQCVLQQCWNKV